MIISRRLGGRVMPMMRSLLHRLRVDSLLRNSVYILITTALTAGSGYIFWVVAARLYPASDVGLASALIGAMTLAATLANLGILPAMIQALPRRANGAEWSLTLNAVFLSGTVSSLLVGVLTALALPLISPNLAVVGRQPDFTLALIAGVPLLTLAALLDAAFTAERASGTMLARTAIFAVMRIPLLAVPALLGHLNALVICVAWALAAGVGVLAGVALLPRLRRDYRVSGRGILKQVRTLLSMVAGHQLISLGALAPVYLLPIIVVARLSLAQNAYFYTAWQVGSIFFIVSPSVGVALQAEGARAPDRVFEKAASSFRITCALLIAPMLLALAGGRLILSMFGPNYALYGYSLLAALVLSAIPDAITNLYVAALRVRRQFRLAASLNLGMGAVALALAWVLLPRMGIAGAGWAWVIAQSAGSLVVLAHVIIAANQTRATGRDWRAQVRAPGARILVITDPCSAGEALRITPSIAQLRRAYPQAAITLVSNADGLNALSRLNDLDHLIQSGLYNPQPYPALIARALQAGAWLRLLWKVGLGYDMVITFYWGSALHHALGYVVCRGRRVGYADYSGRIARWLLSEHLGAFAWRESHPPQHAALLCAAGVVGAESAPPALVWSPNDVAVVDALLGACGVRADARVIALHPGADWACQQWLRERWAELADALVERYHAIVVFTGVASEAPYIEAIQRLMSSDSRSLAGRTSLPQLGALLSRCALCVCVDSAIFEVSQAAGTPSVVLCGPSWPETGVFGARKPLIIRRMSDGLASEISACQARHNALNQLGCWDYSCLMSGLRGIQVADVLETVERQFDRHLPLTELAPATDVTLPEPNPLLAALFGALTAADVRWLLERGEADLASPTGDVDLLIAAADLPRAQAVLAAQRFSIFPSYGSGNPRLLLYFGYHAPTDTWIKLDIATELSYGPLLNPVTVDVEGVLARRERRGSLFLPALDDGFWGILLHCMLDKGAFAPKRARRLREMAPQARANGPLGRAVALACPEEWSSARIIQSVERGEWEALIALGPALIAGWRSHEPARTRALVALAHVRDLVRIPFIRVRRPGVTVALLGPDGAGKSTLADAILDSFLVPSRLVYMGLWKSGPATANAERQAVAARLVRRGIEIAGRLPKAWLRYLVGMTHRALGRVVVFDRYVYDALLSAGEGSSLPKRIYMWTLGHSCPAPDIVLLLDAPGEVMFSRKGESTPEELEKQRQTLFALRSQIPNIQVVDVTREQAVVRADTLRRVWDAYCRCQQEDQDEVASQPERVMSVPGVR